MQALTFDKFMAPNHVFYNFLAIFWQLCCKRCNYTVMPPLTKLKLG